ncbi:hypothetical protein [Aquabacterium sp.]|uniref:hypothetical protein n=1 Tax=Aquabacterium sp. TaxID=1872578 RepID=UPI002622EA43|nr:hypothetical protein [Aquabacterium sp.]MDD2976608.1 hypothetical protein [Aquabacterium sp.]
MTKPKLNNLLYLHLASNVTQALPLEYAIRAARMDNPLELAQLADLHVRIRQYWQDLGATDVEIDVQDLMDYAWDTIQVGFPMSRRHGRVYTNRNLFKLINLGLANVRAQFEQEVDALRIPATRYFRICDLLQGNDIDRMMVSVAQCLRDAKSVESRGDEVELNKFVLNIRMPIHLHPGMHYVARDKHDGAASAESFGILLDTDANFSMPDLVRQIREFLYQYAVRRESLRPTLDHDPITDELIHAFLRDALLGKIPQQKAARLDGLIGPLAGLRCWDLARLNEEKGTSDAVLTAQLDVLKDYPELMVPVGEETMRKNYRLATKAIREVPFSKAQNVRTGPLKN